MKMFEAAALASVNARSGWPEAAMLDFWQKPRFDSDTLSSIWVMACRDRSPVLTAFSVAYRLRGIAPDEVVELVKSRQELFRLGLTRAQSRNWKARYQPNRSAAARQPARPTKSPQGRAKAGHVLPDWLQVFDDQGPAAEQERVREWLGDKTISSSRQALDSFLDDHFVIDEIAFRSQFRIDRDLEVEPSDLATVNWGLSISSGFAEAEAETRQSVVALTTGIGGVAIGAMVALTAPMVTTLYQGRPADTARFLIDHRSASRRLRRAGQGRGRGGARRAGRRRRGAQWCFDRYFRCCDHPVAFGRSRHSQGPAGTAGAYRRRLSGRTESKAPPSGDACLEAMPISNACRRPAGRHSPVASVDQLVPDGAMPTTAAGRDHALDATHRRHRRRCRRAARPVVCYPVETLPAADLALYRAARERLMPR